MQRDLTSGSVLRQLIRFSVPYLISSFLQTFYGLADLFITGQFNGAATISAVSIGSQVMHMLTVMIVGLAMGATVSISRAVGAKDNSAVSRSIGNAVSLFAVLAGALTVILIALVGVILSAVSTPPEALVETRRYLTICFAGIPFITAYNVLSSIFRGLGDSKSPMVFVFVAGVINVLLDFLLIGPMHMGAAGAALATVIAQGISVAFAIMQLRKAKDGVQLSRNDLRFDRRHIGDILRVGVPVMLQDGFIQISFLIITAIANRRGVTVAASVGIVEKVISFLFLVPSAMLSTVSAIAAQNIGAGKHERGRQSLFYGTSIAVCFGLVVAIICQFAAESVLRLFAGQDMEVIRLGAEYLRSYAFDCCFAGAHFCLSGYFCAYGKSIYSFIHNTISIVLVRIPGVLLATALFPDSLYPMGWAAPLGSLLSSFICIGLFVTQAKKWYKQ